MEEEEDDEKEEKELDDEEEEEEKSEEEREEGGDLTVVLDFRPHHLVQQFYLRIPRARGLTNTPVATPHQETPG